MNALRQLRLLVLGLAIVGEVNAEAPAWLLKAAAVPTPSGMVGVPAVVLVDENVIEVNEEGVERVVHRTAVRILETRGSSFASNLTRYLDKQDRIKSCNAWVVRGGTVVKTSDRSDWLDLAVTTELSLCGDVRARSIYFGSDVSAGDVFGAEVSTDYKLLVAQLILDYDSEIPTVLKSYRVTVPAGFKMNFVTHGGDCTAPELTNNGQTLQWEIRGQPLWTSEAWAPVFSRLAPAVGVMIVPPETAHAFRPVVFRTWAEVGSWQEKLQAGQCDSAPDLTTKARQLTASCVDDLSKIRALGLYVQALRYVSDEKNLGQGDGYKPRKASLTFQHAYGDCKDKSNLLSAMLREVGISSHLVCARATEDHEVWPDLPSPELFNHAILAIAVGTDVTLPSVLTVNGERLLFFDATDPHTVVGDLPSALQGSRVALMNPTGDALVQLPLIPAEVGHTCRRSVSMKISIDGTITGKFQEAGSGQVGAEMRRDLFLANLPANLDRFATSQLGDGLRGAQLLDKKEEDDLITGLCVFRFDFSSKDFLQRISQTTAVARLDLLTRSKLPSFSAKIRKLPIALKAIAYNDEIAVELPEGMMLEDLPAKTYLKSNYGIYSREFEVKGKTVVLRRNVQIVAQTLPASEYPQVRQFFSDLNKSDRVTLLLKTGATLAANTN